MACADAAAAGLRRRMQGAQVRSRWCPVRHLVHRRYSVRRRRTVPTRPTGIMRGLWLTMYCSRRLTGRPTSF